MRRLAQFLRTTVTGGFFVVLPLFLVALLLAEAVSAVVDVIAPATDQLPVEEVAGVQIDLLLAATLVLLACFATGLIMQTELGVRSNRWLEQTVLDRLPGYVLIRGLTRRISGVEESARFAPALIQLHEGVRALGFIVEEHGTGTTTVFVPATPMATVGSLYFVEPERIQNLDVPMTRALTCIAEWGVGSAALLARKPAAPSP